MTCKPLALWVGRSRIRCDMVQSGTHFNDRIGAMNYLNKLLNALGTVINPMMAWEEMMTSRVGGTYVGFAEDTRSHVLI